MIDTETISAEDFLDDLSYIISWTIEKSGRQGTACLPNDTLQIDFKSIQGFVRGDVFYSAENLGIYISGDRVDRIQISPDREIGSSSEEQIQQDPRCPGVKPGYGQNRKPR